MLCCAAEYFNGFQTQHPREKICAGNGLPDAYLMCGVSEGFLYVGKTPFLQTAKSDRSVC